MLMCLTVKKAWLTNTSTRSHRVKIPASSESWWKLKCIYKGCHGQTLRWPWQQWLQWSRVIAHHNTRVFCAYLTWWRAAFLFLAAAFGVRIQNQACKRYARHLSAEAMGEWRIHNFRKIKVNKCVFVMKAKFAQVTEVSRTWISNLSCQFLGCYLTDHLENMYGRPCISPD